MTEHYKHHEPNGGAVDSFVNQAGVSNQSTRYDSSIVFLLITIGIFGLYYIPKSPFAEQASSSDRAYAQSGYTGFQANYSQEATATAAPTQEEQQQASKRQLFIVGEKTAGQAIFFTIDSYDEQANYQLDLGNGKILDVDRKTIRYTYPKAGKYQLKLQVSYQGEQAMIHSEKIWIGSANERMIGQTAGNGF